MKTIKTTIPIAILTLVILVLAGCGPGTGGASLPSEPTMTAIPLPTRTAVQVAEATTAPSPTLPPTEMPSPTATPSPESTATATPEPTATPTAVPPSPTPTVEPPTATVTAKPTRSQPKPTATPEYTGKLVFQTTMGGDFYTIQADGSGLRRITDGVDARWSPDGRQIAFTRWREPRGVWAVDVDEAGIPSNERRLFDWNESRWPSWSPDGQEILFSRQHGGKEPSQKCFWGFCFTLEGKPYWPLAMVNTSDLSFREPPSEFISLAPDWSAGGERIVYSSERGLHVQNLDKTVSYWITDDYRDTSPVWSPDGSRIAFVRRQHDHWEIYAVDPDGRNLTRLTTTPERPDGTPGNSAGPAWSPDGRHIAFFTDRAGGWQIWVMNANGANQKPMFASALDGLPLEYSFVADRAISWTR
jgi:Tol biopolymer transport system component